MNSVVEEIASNRIAATARLVGPIVVRGVAANVRRRGSARRNVLVGLIVFVAFQLFAGVAVERDWWPIADPIFTEKAELLRRRAAFFAERSPDSRVLALGSSRTQLAFDARRFSAGVTGTTAFNFGTPGGGPITCLLYWKRLQREGCRADVVFVEVHPALWCGLTVPFEARWLQEHRLKPGEPALLRSLGWNVSDPPQHAWYGKIETTSSFRLGLLNRHSPALLPCRFGLTIGDKNDEFGTVHGIQFEERERTKALQRAKAEYAECFPAPPSGGAAVAAVRMLLAEIQAAGTVPILLVPPEAEVMRAWYGPHHPDDLRSRLAALQREFAVDLIDGRDWVDDRHFTDGHHLSAAGGAIFTDRLIAAVNSRGPH